jgi:hypothetical protein
MRQNVQEMKMTGRGKRYILTATLAAVALTAVPGFASAAAPSGDSADRAVCSSPAAGPATKGVPCPGDAVEIAVKGNPRVVGVLRKVRVEGSIPTPTPGAQVTIRAYTGKRKVDAAKVETDPVTGAFSWTLETRACCRYTIYGEWGGSRSNPVSFKVAVPGHLGAGARTKFFNKLLRDAGYHQVAVSRRLNWSSRLAMLAFRKVNGMSWNSSYSRKIFRLLLEGKGEFKPKHPGAGTHVEVDISRQVMAFIRKGKAVHVFHVSTGAPSSPTIQGKFHFYLRQPGYNPKMMYYSVYFSGNYATHGYSSVPNYNASHGCVRNPIPYSVFIYNWIDLGMTIYVYQ